MIFNKHISISALSIALLAISCSKHRLDIAVSSQRATQFNKMQISGDFNWSTYQKIELKYLPSLLADKTAVITIKDSKGNILFTRNQDLTKQFNASILVPIHETRLIVQIGSNLFSKPIQPNSKIVHVTP